MFSNRQIVYSKELGSMKYGGIASLILGGAFFFLLFFNPDFVRDRHSGEAVVLLLGLLGALVVGLGAMSLNRYAAFKAYFDATGAVQGTMEDVRAWKLGGNRK